MPTVPPLRNMLCHIRRRHLPDGVVVRANIGYVRDFLIDGQERHRPLRRHPHIHIRSINVHGSDDKRVHIRREEIPYDLLLLCVGCFIFGCHDDEPHPLFTRGVFHTRAHSKPMLAVHRLEHDPHLVLLRQRTR